ncbi:hypothetical protein JCM31185_06430 [Furfurilactobacillus curtus]|uniref:Uncharacterized protein n=1 Tax=Furfurilactobacillus curtus TaxID=1746200 RepID=A0ABQ5JPT8_9LACO
MSSIEYLKTLKTNTRPLKMVYQLFFTIETGIIMSICKDGVDCEKRSVNQDSLHYFGTIIERGIGY